VISAEPVAERVSNAVRAVREVTDRKPDVAIILGTGLSGLADQLSDASVLGYERVPGFPASTVETHAGRLIFGVLEGRHVAVMQGRTHLYEGYSLADVTLPVRVLRALGVERMIVSNVSGGMNPLWGPGDLVLITDHINLLGDNPLVGPHVDPALPRFPDMSRAYDEGLARVAREEALRLGIPLREGVYVAVAGPCLETAAEYRMLRTLGADVIGMSTVPEVIVARQVGIQVLGLSIITDACLPDALEPADIDTIVKVAGEAEPHLSRLVRATVARLTP
jgi:purine-nucleoside phosphorylase